MGDVRGDLRVRLHAMMALDGGALRGALDDWLAPDCLWRAAHPVGDLLGADAIHAGWVEPLRRALPGAMRRDDLFLSGVSVTGSGVWVASLGHYVGNFVAPLFGIMPHGRLVFLRIGEFYRIEDGRVVEARLLPDLIDLSRQAGRPLVPPAHGSELTFPAPATQDGICPSHPERSKASVDLVSAMLFDLHAYDPVTFASTGQTGEGGYWHRDMLWYGPGGVGSNFTYPGFDRDHRVPFLTAFPDRKGGDHFARFGDGDYVCSGGWPSMTMTHRGPYLGVAPTGRAMTLRVMDFWRCESGRIMENWVLLDLLDWLAQAGVDVLAESANVS